MEILEKKVGTVTIIGPVGRLDAYASAEMEKKVNPVVETPNVALVINLEKLDYISSSGLRILLAGLKKAKKGQGDMRLSGMQAYVKEVFEMAGFMQLFKVFEKEEEAINSFK